METTTNKTTSPARPTLNVLTTALGQFDREAIKAAADRIAQEGNTPLEGWSDEAFERLFGDLLK